MLVHIRKCTNIPTNMIDDQIGRRIDGAFNLNPYNL